MDKRWRFRIANLAWTAAWMWPLIGAVIDIAAGRVHPVFWAAAGLSAFVGLYLTLVMIGFSPGHVRVKPWQLAMALVAAAIGSALLWSFGGHEYDWANIMLYVSICGTVLLRPVWAAAWTLGSVLVLIAWAVTGAPSSRLRVGDLAPAVFGMFLVSGLVYAIKEMQRYIRLLRSTRAKLAATAVSEERLRFSRDLHDLLGHTMSLIVVKAEVVRRLAEHDPVAAAREAAEIEAIGRKALSEIRDAVSGYREPEFATEVDMVQSALAGAGIAVRVNQPVEVLPAPANTLFGWAVREASTNAIRHSKARVCVISVRNEADIATLEVSDDGVGGRPAESTGTGLLGLRERFAVAGGTVETFSPQGKGFRLVAKVPTVTLDNTNATILEPTR